jgi:hypothetical protein
MLRSRARWALALAAVALGGGCGFGGGSSAGSGTTGAADSGGAGTSGTAGIYGATGSAGTGNSGSGSAGTSTGTGGAFGTGSAGTGSMQGTGGAGGGASGSTGSGASGTTGSGGSAIPQDGGAVDSSTGCFITVDPPPSALNLEAGPTATLSLQASVSGYAGGPDGGPPSWTWTANMAARGAVSSVGTTSTDPSGASVEVSIATAGIYQVQAFIADAPTCVSQPYVYLVSPPATPTYRFRVMPPSDSQLPMREVVVSTPFSGSQAIALDDVPASVVTLSPVDVHGFAAPSYLRITSPSFSFMLEGDTRQGPFMAPLETPLSYEVLIVPDDTGLAPLLVSGLPSSLLTQMAVTPGATVTGVARDGGGNPIAGAQVILTAGDRPSTIGVTDAGGGFSLLTREGPMAADIMAPAGSGLPDAHVAASPGVMLLEGMASLDVAMDYANLPSGPLTVSVTGPGPGASPVAGAHVRVDLATPILNAGALTVLGPTGTVLPATGTAHADALTDAQGLADLGLLPAGMYHAIVAPPDGMAGAAITLADVVVSSSAATVPVALAPPTTLSGTLMPAAAAGAKLTAIDRGLLAAVNLPTAIAAADGTYALTLAAGRTYELLVEPKPGLALARSVVAVVTATVGGPARVDVVPAALPWTGKVTDMGIGVAGAIVEAYCAEPAATCLDSTLAVAQATTAADGSLTLALPTAATGP